MRPYRLVSVRPQLPRQSLQLCSRISSRYSGVTDDFLTSFSSTAIDFKTGHCPPYTLSSYFLSSADTISFK